MLDGPRPKIFDVLAFLYVPLPPTGTSCGSIPPLLARAVPARHGINVKWAHLGAPMWYPISLLTRIGFKCRPPMGRLLGGVL